MFFVGAKTSTNFKPQNYGCDLAPVVQCYDSVQVPEDYRVGAELSLTTGSVQVRRQLQLTYLGFDCILQTRRLLHTKLNTLESSLLGIRKVLSLESYPLYGMLFVS